MRSAAACEDPDRHPDTRRGEPIVPLQDVDLPSPSLDTSMINIIETRRSKSGL